MYPAISPHFYRCRGGVAVAEENMAALQFGGSKNQKAPRISILRRNLKAGASVVIAVAMTCILGVTPSRALAVDGRTAPGKLRVGTTVAPPFAMKASDGRWEGLGIELWQKIAAELDVEYEFAEFESIEQVLEAFKKKELDLVPAMAITESLETDLDFSNAFIESGSAIAVRADGGGKRLRHFGGIAMPPGSPLREPVNRALLKIIATDDWIRLTLRSTDIDTIQSRAKGNTTNGRSLVA
jgi:ABC-type amino acid transport substrate-binding protein